jgi:hypothetical protein
MHVSSFGKGFSIMIFEYLLDAFDRKDSTNNNFIQCHKLNSHIAIGHFSSSLFVSLVTLGFWLWPNP